MNNWENNIKSNLHEITSKGVSSIYLGQNRNLWWSLPNRVMKFLLYKRWRNFPIIGANVSFPRETPLDGVRKFYGLT
jgi:hypothetical protein